MLRNLLNKLYKVLLLTPQTVTATGNSSSQDVKDLMSLSFLLAVGTMAFTGTDKLTVVIEHSDDNSSFSTSTESDSIVLDSGSEDESLFGLEYKGNKRYARLAWTEGGTVSVPMTVIGVGLSKIQPPA